MQSDHDATAVRRGKDRQRKERTESLETENSVLERLLLLPAVDNRENSLAWHTLNNS